MTMIAAIYTVAEDEPPYPAKPPYPPEPVGEGFRAAVEWIAWHLKTRRIDREHERIVRDWPYATKVAIHGVLTIPCALKVIESGETILADEHGDLHRGYGACRPSLLKAGQQLIYLGSPYSNGASFS